MTAAVLLLYGAGLAAASDTVTLTAVGEQGPIKEYALTVNSEIRFLAEGISFEGGPTEILPYEGVVSLDFPAPVSVKAVTTQQCTLIVKEGYISLTRTLEAPSSLQVADLNGTVYLSIARWDGAPVSIAALPGGSYIASTPDRSAKFIIR